LLSHQGYYKAHAGIALPNPGSIGLHEALGMTLVGVYKAVGFKLGAWHDVAWYQGALQSQQPNPARPIPITALLNTPQFDQALASGLAYYRG
jgi:phosphinothricin acetyltransferase